MYNLTYADPFRSRRLRQHLARRNTPGQFRRALGGANGLPPPVGDFIESLAPYASYIFLFVLFILPRMGFDIVSAMVYPLQEFLIRMLFW